MIEVAGLDDAEEILAMINVSNRERYQDIIPKEHFRDPFMSLDKLLNNFAKMRFFVFKRDDEILGVAALQTREEVIGTISRLYVRPDCQRQGIGSALVAHLEQAAIRKGVRRLRLRVGEKAAWAINFYMKLGYNVIDRMQRPEGFIFLMEKQLWGRTA